VSDLPDSISNKIPDKSASVMPQGKDTTCMNHAAVNPQLYSHTKMKYTHVVIF